MLHQNSITYNVPALWISLGFMLLWVELALSLPTKSAPIFTANLCTSDKECNEGSTCRTALLPPDFARNKLIEPISICSDGSQDITRQIHYCHHANDCAFQFLQGVHFSCDLTTKACLYLKTESPLPSQSPDAYPTHTTEEYDMRPNSGDYDNFPSFENPKNIIIFVAFSLLFIFGCIIVYLILRTHRERKDNQRRRARGAGHRRHPDSTSSWTSVLSEQDRLMMGIGRIPTLPPYGPWEETPPYFLDKMPKAVAVPETAITQSSRLVFESPPTYEVSFRTSFEPGSHLVSALESEPTMVETS